jgi:CheY-like chemotaxis protein
MAVRVRDANEGLLREIEERKKVEAEREVLLEREREMSRLKDEFVATVSHELRTPLSAIMGWTQVLETARLDQNTLEKAIGVIGKNARIQARIIDDLVDVSRIGTGKLHLLREPLDLRAPVEAGVDMARGAAVAKGIRIEQRLPGHPLMVKGDGDRLRQVVENLVTNAVKFSESGALVTVTAHDLGPVFEIDAIVKEVTELHGGSVSATSGGEGQGSSFRVCLPALVDLSVAPPDDRMDQPTEPARLDGVEVLAVDDNADALDVLALSLRAVGARVRTATSGAEAIEAWEVDPPDILLCDLAMPEMDGFDVLAKIRQKEGGAERPTAAIAVSAHATVEHRRRSLAAGFTEHVAKPYRISDLVRAVSAALNT